MVATTLASQAGVHLDCFGAPALRVDGRDCRVSLRRGLALLAYLAFNRAPVPRSYLSWLLWPDADEPTARARLRRLAYQLEDATGTRLFAGDGDTLSLRDGALRVDAIEFANAARGEVAGSASTVQVPDQLLERAFLPLLHGIELESSEFEDWRRARSLEHEHLLARLLAHRVEAMSAEGRAAAALPWAERMIALDRYCEPSYVALMRLHAADGNAAGVEAAFMRCAQELRSEFGSKPCAGTEQAYLALMQGLQTDSGGSGELRVRFAESGHEAVAYATIGDGKEAVVIIPGFISHIEIAWEQPAIRAFVQSLAQTHTVVVFDRRGVGLSERIGATCSAEAAESDVITLLDHAGIERAWLFGSSEGGPIALRLAANHPQRVRGVVLMGAMAKGSASDDYPWALPPQAFDAWMAKMQADWGGPADIAMFAPSAEHDPQMRAWWARMLRHATSPSSMRATLHGLRDVDVRALLPRISVPTLVLHRRDDRAVRFDAGQYLARSIPGAQWQPLDGEDHWWWCGDVDSVLGPVKAFLAGQDAGTR